MSIVLAQSELTGPARILLLLELLPLLGLLLYASLIDWRRRKIPNWLTFMVLAAGLTRAAYTGEFTEGLFGVLAGLALIFPLYVMGAMGAGDVKLMAGLGAWLLSRGVLEVFLLAAVLGVVLLVTQAAAAGNLRRLISNTGLLVTSTLAIRRIGVEQAAVNGRKFSTVDKPLPYAVPVTAAVLLTMSGVQLL